MKTYQGDDPDSQPVIPQNLASQTAQPTNLIILFTSLAHDLTWLVRQEIQLVRTEFTEKSARATQSISTLAIGGFLAYGGVITLLLAASFGL